MRQCPWRAAVLPALAAALLASVACNKGKDSAPGGPGTPNPGGPGMPGGMGGRPGGAATPIGKIMEKLTKGPQSLTPKIGAELQQDPPPWETIGPQAKEFAQLAASMAQYDPPKGSKESWAKLTASYSESAAALDRAAQAKDKDAALSAHDTLAHSCMACHQAHRMGPGMGGGGFRPPGAPPQ